MVHFVETIVAWGKWGRINYPIIEQGGELAEA